MYDEQYFSLFFWRKGQTVLLKAISNYNAHEFNSSSINQKGNKKVKLIKRLHIRDRYIR